MALGPARLLVPIRGIVEPLHPGMCISWIVLQSSSASCRLLLRLPHRRCKHLYLRQNSSPVMCSAAQGAGSHFAEEYEDAHLNNPRLHTMPQTTRELPWNVSLDDAAEHYTPRFGAPSPQRTPWDQGVPKTLANKSKKFPGSAAKDENMAMHSNGQERSVMVNIVEKLRAIDRKNQANQQRRYSTSSVPALKSPRRGSEKRERELLFKHEPVNEAIFPWETNSNAPAVQPQPSKTPSLAELTLPEDELRRLQRLALAVTNPVKLGYLGVTKAVVQSMHERWQRYEVVKVKCEGPPAVNMKKTHEELETKTGGLVIWRTGGMALVYRGKAYFSRVENKLLAAVQKHRKSDEEMQPKQELIERGEPRRETFTYEKSHPESGITYDASHERVEKRNLEEEYVNEVDALLDELGPRYDDWIGARPVPVDGDLLPACKPGFKPPLRMLPYRVKPNLTNMELTVLRKLARPLPPHFVLGRNRGLQGLAAAILKLWEKSEIVKIGVKRGVQNTRNQLMSEELKRLTGGVLLARDKHFITMYRGKDFLPPSVATVLKERELNTEKLQDQEDRVRRFGRTAAVQTTSDVPTVSGTFSESLDVKKQWDDKKSEEEDEKNRSAALLAVRVREQRRLEAKLATAMAKKRRADMQIAKLEQALRISEPPKDRETITDEERFMFRKLGLKMDAFLLMGRRGVFDGVIENMHLHWKHRELAKVIIKEREKPVAQEVAKMLEIESGGILVGVITTSKGQAIIMYRGKNYQRPPELRPRTLLTKRKALARSKEVQRKEALQLHINKLEDLIQKYRRDYDYMLKNNDLPESPRTALYKEIDIEYEQDDEDQEEESLDERPQYSDTELSLGEDEDVDDDEGYERFRDGHEEEEEKDDEASDWDLETEDEDDSEDEKE